jgi:ketosteroid isomerase-like protein
VGHPRPPDHPRQGGVRRRDRESGVHRRRPELDVRRVHEDGPVVVTTGEGRGVSVDHGRFRFAFNDLFTFRDRLIARVDSYLVPLPEAAVDSAGEHSGR